MLRAEGIHKRYRRNPPVLAGVDLALDGPVVLSGANGSGKSTLLRIVAGCTSPTAGRVRGRPRVVGYLPDRFPAQLRMPAGVYLRHLAAIRGTRAEPELLDALGFAGPREEAMARLSKGNAQKVGLAQALGGDPGLVVLDEPWAGLDRAAADRLPVLLARLDVPVLVTDHTGRAARIPGARHVRLVDGVLTPESVPAPADADTGPIAAAAVAVVLRAADPAALLVELGLPGRVDADRAWLTLPAGEVDAVLLATLRRGGSVVSVGPA
ncbi:ATP-binding cassette domain-containing protein [Pseudonocardia sp. WMMC193]|uniref:ATP-binding cassette domain-containing protein n=1 Tax=Pseudonocardia sp. WMMC193 TaxID=2911965 RepID=UPI001F0068D9|nr:ATP-binding cassette domain-containing protein [Pseudonocardia sp. WMMC193]MCF7551381.1 ATP-binding cassette domain-containing protein [Pseudonocardia sp. WMMC193]